MLFGDVYFSGVYKLPIVRGIVKKAGIIRRPYSAVVNGSACSKKRGNFRIHFALKHIISTHAGLNHLFTGISVPAIPKILAYILV
jgi:hypothetical protein